MFQDIGTLRASKDAPVEEIEGMENEGKDNVSKHSQEPNLKDYLASETSRTDQISYLEGSYGLGPIVFPALQRFNNIHFFLVLYCILILSQGIIFGLVDLSTGKFEKDYYLSKPEKFALTQTYGVTSCVVALFVAHYGGRGHRPRWMAYASFLIGLGAVFFAIPYLNYDIIKPQENVTEICQELRIPAICEKITLSLQTSYILYFVLGKITEGMGAMSLYILGRTFIYDSVNIHKSGIFIGLGEASGTLGYGVGYVLGSIQLAATKEHFSSNETDLGHKVFKIGWLSGFLATALIAWCTFIPFLLFPHSLPGTHRIRVEKDRQLDSFAKKFDKEFGTSLKDLFSSILVLLKNPLLVCQALCKSTESIALAGVSELLPKYLENQFLLTPAVATMFTGVILIPGAVIGYFLGGLIVNKLKMSFKGLLKFSLATSTIALTFLVLISFVHCKSVKFAGINEDYDGKGQLGNLTASCNEHCTCTSSVYSSVCGRDEVEYFSPCFAGCIDMKNIDNEKTYYNCSCIHEGLATADEDGDFIDAIPGKCDTRCYKLPLFFALFFSSIIFSTLSFVPVILTIIRSVPEKLRSMAMGMTYTIFRIFGTIPAPLILRIASSSSCIYWNINPCGVKGRCWIYDKSRMVYILLGTSFSSKVLTIIFTSWALAKYSYWTKENKDNKSMTLKCVKETQNRKK